MASLREHRSREAARGFSLALLPSLVARGEGCGAVHGDIDERILWDFYEKVDIMGLDMMKYRKRCQSIGERSRRTSNFIANIRLAIFLCVLFAAYMAFIKAASIFFYLAIAFLGAFAGAVYIHKKAVRKSLEQEFYLALIKKYENRKNGLWQEETLDHVESSNMVCEDLNLLNQASLLKYINFTQSLGAKEALIKSLSLENQDLSVDSIILKQQAILELTEKFKFILGFQYAMSCIKNIGHIDYKSYFPLFSHKAANLPRHRILSLGISLAVCASFLLYELDKVPGLIFFAAFAASIGYSYLLMLKYKEIYDDIDKCAKKYNGLQEVYAYIEKEPFAATMNKRIKAKIAGGKKILREIVGVSDLNSFKLNFLTYLIGNGFFALNFWLLYSYDRLLTNKIEDFKESIVALEELEQNISFSTIGLVKNNTCVPTISEELALDIEKIKHPLLDEGAYIDNDFQCDKNIVIITGSNMSGKTSFIKAIAINLVLAYNGSMVNAGKFTAPLGKIFTAINIKDDISQGISTFYGELKRLKEILDFSQNDGGKMIIFIDEIFKGTNYNDRLFGAKETIRRLSALPCIVFITTHDFELCKSNVYNVINYHFAEAYEGEKITFDHKIRQGQCKATNARYLMRTMGLYKV